MSKMWPGNDLSRLTPQDRMMHDHLCELLSGKMSEQDVCTASVGIWGAISVMRDYLNLAKLENDSLETRIRDLLDQISRLEETVKDFNSNAKKLDAYREKFGEL